ncbi:MAG: 30S ribosomal protein S20 [Clostridia bacterium]|nr:30S ribosomal protein S20 [Clostridia bacterium]
MPNIKSAKKRVKTTETKALQNKIFRTKLKNEIKKFDAAVAAGDKEAAKVTYTAAVKRADQAAVRGIIHKNAAARKKSQLTKKLNAMA